MSRAKGISRQVLVERLVAKTDLSRPEALRFVSALFGVFRDEILAGRSVSLGLAMGTLRLVGKGRRGFVELVPTRELCVLVQEEAP